MRDAGFDVSTATVDVSSRESIHALVETSTAFGDVTGLIHAAGVSPSQASPAAILACRPLRNCGACSRSSETSSHAAAPGWSSRRSPGIVSGALTAEQNAALATTPADELLDAADASARPGDGPAPRLPAGQARELAARDGRGRPVGQARGADQHDQPRHHHHPTRQGRADRSARRGIPTHDRAVPGRARRHPRRGREPSARSSWAPTARSSPAATSSWTAASPPPTSTASSPPK